MQGLELDFSHWFDEHKNDDELVQLYNEVKLKRGFSGGFRTWAKEFYNEMANYKQQLEPVFTQINKLVSNFVTLNGEMHDYMLLKKGHEFQTALLMYDSQDPDMFTVGLQLGKIMKQSQADLVVLMQEVVARKIDEKDLKVIMADDLKKETERPIYYPESMRDHLLRFMLINKSMNIEAFAKRFKKEDNKITILDNELVRERHLN
jgi:hypothetical protein